MICVCTVKNVLSKHPASFEINKLLNIIRINSANRLEEANPSKTATANRQGGLF
jgi:hypothetical protein